MATLYISESDVLGIDGAGNPIPSLPQPPLAAWSIPITGASTQSQEFNSRTRYIEMRCDAACSFAIGVDPVAVTTALGLGAGERIFYPLRTDIPGPLRLAVIANV
jgi:hypothetical protein